MDFPVSLQFQELSLNALLSIPQNKYCADCKFQSPDWISLNYGVLICYKCSGIHRSLGVQNTRVKSVKLDTLTLRQLFIMAYVHNEKANEYWEANMPSDIVRPGTSTAPRELSQFIRAKYIDRAFVDSNREPPLTYVNRKLNEDGEDKENENNDSIFKRKSAELKRLIKSRVAESKPAPLPVISIRNKLKEEESKAREPKAGKLQGKAVTPSAAAMKTFKANFGADASSPQADPQYLFVKSNSDASSFPLFEGLTMRSPRTKLTPIAGRDLGKQQPQLSQLGSSVFSDSSGTSMKNSGTKVSMSPHGPQISTLPSIGLEQDDSDVVTPQNRDLRKHPLQSIEKNIDGLHLHKQSSDRKIYIDSIRSPKQFEAPENEDMNYIEANNVVIDNSRYASLTPIALEKQKSITVTLKEAQKESKHISHLKRPSEAFESVDTTTTGIKVISLIKKRNEKYPKFLVIVNCLLIHILLGFIFTWGTISPYISSFLSRSYHYSLYTDYTDIAGCNIFLYIGLALGTFMSERFVNLFGMRISSLVCFLSTSAIILLSSLTNNSFVHSVLFTMLPGLFLGLIYYIPFYYAIQYFYYPGALKIFFYLANGIGAFMFANLFPLLLLQEGIYKDLTATSPQGDSHYYPERVDNHVPLLIQVIGLSLLVFGVISSLMLHPKLNFVDKDWSNWEDKEEGLLSRTMTPKLLFSRSQCEMIEIQPPKKIEANASKYLFFISIFIFIFSGFLFYSYKISGFLHNYSDASLSIMGGIGMLILGVGKAIGVFTYRKFDFRHSLRIAAVSQAILGLLYFFFIDNRIIFVVSFLAAMLLQGIIMSLLVEEAANAFDIEKESLLTGIVIFGFALSNSLSFLILKGLLMFRAHEWLYLALTMPLIFAFGFIQYYPKTRAGARKKSQLHYFHK